MTATNTTPNEPLTFTATEIVDMIHSVKGIKTRPAPTATDELRDIRTRFTYVGEGLEGIGLAMASPDEVGEVTMGRLASAVYALGEYAGDLNERLDLVTMRIDKEAAAEEAPHT